MGIQRKYSWADHSGLSGDCVSIRVINPLPEATSVHWHGLDVPNMMDGVPEIEPSPKIKPGEYFDYR